MNAVKKLITILIFIILTIIVVVCNVLWINPHQITYDNIDIYSSKIDSQLQDLTILFFSDIDYGEFVDETRLANAITLIDDYDADVIIFGGDIFYKNATVSEQDYTLLQTYFTQLEAPLGKFYVLGDNDYTQKDEIDNLLQTSGFESLENNIVHLRKYKSSTINLIGFSNIINGDTSTIHSLLDNLSPNTYNLAICHTPDIASSISYNIDYLLCGDSHGGQIYFPFIGGLYTSSGSQTYQHGNYKVNDYTLHISNGIGTEILDARFLADAQITILTLNSQ